MYFNRLKHLLVMCFMLCITRKLLPSSNWLIESVIRSNAANRFTDLDLLECFTKISCLYFFSVFGVTDCFLFFHFPYSFRRATNRHD